MWTYPSLVLGSEDQGSDEDEDGGSEVNWVLIVGIVVGGIVVVSLVVGIAFVCVKKRRG